MVKRSVAMVGRLSDEVSEMCAGLNRLYSTLLYCLIFHSVASGKSTLRRGEMPARLDKIHT